MNTRRIGLALLLMVAIPVGARGEDAADAEDTEDAGASGETQEPAVPAEKPADFQDYGDLSLEDLLDTEVSVATPGASQTQAESPAIVTVVTRDEIARSGARDLIDVLRLVPGFDFGVDIMGIVSAGVRGLWATEGKLLLLLDGHELNELSYLNNLFANRHSLDWIERIEIIRGPGSVAYGGSAELAVVSIITRRAAEQNGISARLNYGQMLDGPIGRGLPLERAYGRRTLSFSYGQRFAALDDLAVKLDFFVGQGRMSDRRYTDIEGASFDMGYHNRLDPLALNLAVEWKGLKLRYYFEDYRTTSRDAYDYMFPCSIPNNFTWSSLQAVYAWEVVEGLTLTPFLGWNFQKPWRATSQSAWDLDMQWEPVAQRLKAGLSAAYVPLSFLSFQAGYEFDYDTARDSYWGYPEPATPDPDDLRTEIFYNNHAAYLEGQCETPYVNVAAGARFEHHSSAGSSFVPRGALTKAFGPFHFKFLAAQAFRVPNLENLGEAEGLKPERTTVLELELGYRVAKWLSVSVNGFYTTIQDTIVYGEGPDEETGYQNAGRTGSRGAELVVRFKLDRYRANLGFSYYDATGMNEIANFAVPGKPNVLLGFPPYKLTLEGGVDVTEDLAFHLSLLVYSDQRFAYRRPVDSALPRYGAEDLGAYLLANAYFSWRNLFIKGLFLGFGAYNITNTRQVFIQPYGPYDLDDPTTADLLHPPIPGPSFELLLKLGYDFSFGIAP